MPRTGRRIGVCTDVDTRIDFDLGRCDNDFWALHGTCGKKTKPTDKDEQFVEHGLRFPLYNGG
jgi:hypothetical protein